MASTEDFVNAYDDITLNIKQVCAKFGINPKKFHRLRKSLGLGERYVRPPRYVSEVEEIQQEPVINVASVASVEPASNFSKQHDVHAMTYQQLAMEIKRYNSIPKAERDPGYLNALLDEFSMRQKTRI